MANHSDCDHSNCNIVNANQSVCQTLSEMDWERSLWNAAFSGEEERVRSLINRSRNPKDVVNAVDQSGYTPLHYAARKGHVNVCKILMQNGASINAQTRSAKATPLHKAAGAGHALTVKFLIDSGACLEMQDADGKTALDKVTENKHFEIVDMMLEACPSLGGKSNLGENDPI